jgi:type IV secretory pathway TraG/TraD family ATPase VirD4
VSARGPRSATDVALGGLFGLVAVGACAWAGGALSSLLSGHGIPHGRPLAGLAALAHLGNPRLVWHRPVGPPPLYWTTSVLILALGAGLGVLAWRCWRSAATADRRPGPGEGFASRQEVRRSAGAAALLPRGATLRPSLADPKPDELGYLLGHSRGVACFASVEDSMLLLGPPRSGKGYNVVVPMLLDAPGAVVTTSTRPDNLALCLEARAARGPVAVFDPQGLCHGATVGPQRRWSLVRGCEDPQVAMIRAQALVFEASTSGVDNATFWRQQALSATRGLLHAAALDGRPPADLYRWSHTAAGAKEAVAILGRYDKAAPGWERALDAIIASDQRTRDSVWAMVANTFAPLADPRVLEAVSPADGAALDPAELLAENGTLFLLGTASGASATATLVAALIEDVIDAARRLAARASGQRLDPPLCLVLDEAANYPLPSLPALMSEGGGSGITTLAVLQSLSQARDRWGREAAGAIWDSAIVKLVLGGSANAEDLSDLSRLIGEREFTEWSQSMPAGTLGVGASGRSMSSSTRWRPILEPSEIRRLPLGEGLLLLRAAPPVLLRLRPWTTRPDAAALLAGRRRFEDRARGVRDAGEAAGEPRRPPATRSVPRPARSRRWASSRRSAPVRVRRTGPEGRR